MDMTQISFNDRRDCLLLNDHSDRNDQMDIRLKCAKTHGNSYIKVRPPLVSHL